MSARVNLQGRAYLL